MATAVGNKRKHVEIEDRDPKRVRSNYSKTITVLVGPTEESFTVHEDILCKRSDFFNAAASKGFQEANTRVVRLPEQNPRLFQVYVELVYVHSVNLYSIIANDVDELLQLEKDDAAEYSAETKRGRVYVELYILGDYLGDLHFRNRTMRSLVRSMNKGNVMFEHKEINLTFEATPPDCGLQMLCADIIADGISKARHVDLLSKHLSPNWVPAVLKAKLEGRCPREEGERVDLDEEHYIET